MAECFTVPSNEVPFSQFFGTGDSTFTRASRDDGNLVFQEFFGRKKAPVIERTLPCTLEDFYKGTIRKMKISRDLLLANGETMTIEEILTIEVKKGWKKGTKITFPEKGDQKMGITPADIVFIVDEKPHTTLKRDGDDLVITKKISVGEALTGYTVNLTTLDGRYLSIPIHTVIFPGFEKVVKGEGMPVSKDPSKKGNLRILFDVKYPSELTSEQKMHVRRAFPEAA